ncbi:MAG: phosphoglucosamine mutase [Peptoniphilaceae bacterium]|nr:phosphoglucosamine mutase [Peptoniphilaceae bacterium]MDD7383405.1 phosphoglucosamine mutase [Peptoniphilaceae bacterium]MDY3738800.1 phosphoglucosamine mutase [Peptoniphilaceae bacterium]
MKYFGTDGFRGEANVGLNVYHAFKIGRFIGNYFNKYNNGSGKIVLGKDTRRSSYMFEDALSAGITSSGSDCYLLHVTTTPSMSYVINSGDFDCGIMITASHNPFNDNGIKLFNSFGEKMEDSILELLEEYIDNDKDTIKLATGEDIGRTVDYSQGRNSYIAYLIQTVTRSFKHRRVGLDCANGAASSIAKSVFDALGADTFVINNKPDGFNINVNSGSTHIENLQKFVIDNNLDCGFAFDGDADRCIGVDNEGKIMDGDSIIYVCSNYLKEHNSLENNEVVTTIMSNLGLYKALDRVGIKYVKTSVGDKFVQREMSERGDILGGEQSGHIIFSKYANTGDGILTSLRMMEVMIENKTDFSALTRDLIIYPQTLENIKVTEKEKVLENKELIKKIKEIEKELGTEGRVLVRASGTEKLIRVMIEAKSKDLCDKYAGEIIHVIENTGYVK